VYLIPASLYYVMKKLFFILMSLLVFNACSSDKPDDGSVPLVIRTLDGDIHIAIYPEKAPLSCKAFLELVDKGVYKDASFYRVMNLDNQSSDAPKAEFVQGGIWANKKKSGKLPLIPHEPTNKTGILHKTGTLSLARNEPGTADSEFFICLDDQPGLDYGGENNPDGQGYAAFGMVTRGMDIVRKIYSRPDTDQYLNKPVLIIDIERE
jgi:peptidyl-prolyl cis-trans isomerase A (cyclophilin A)